MGSKQQQKRAALHEKLQQLRSATNSTATDSTAIIDDASKYIEELIEKVEKLNLENILIQSDQSTASTSSNPTSSSLVTVEAVEKGFKINVYSQKNYHGLLISILDAFDDLGLDVHDATISCSDSFHLEALGCKNKDQVGDHSINEEDIKRALFHAMKTWND